MGHPHLDVRRAVRVALADLGDGALVLVACSGGADSLSLAAATAWVTARSGGALRAGAVCVDHGLQEGSAARARSAASALVRLGLDPVVTVHLDASRGPDGPEGNARAARYAALTAAASRAGASAVLLGHTLDDQAETVLLGLARGSGLRSLSGMAERSGLLRRPLLGLRRSVVRAAVLAAPPAGLVPWEDPHNEDAAYARARVRHRVLPLLEAELGPGVTEALARTAALARADADALDAAAAEALAALGLPGAVGAPGAAGALGLPGAVGVPAAPDSPGAPGALAASDSPGAPGSLGAPDSLGVPGSPSALGPPAAPDSFVAGRPPTPTPPGPGGAQPYGRAPTTFAANAAAATSNAAADAATVTNAAATADTVQPGRDEAARELDAAGLDAAGPDAGGLDTAGPDAGGLDVGGLGALPQAVRWRVLRRAAIAAGSPPTDLTAGHVAAVDALVVAWRGQAGIDLPGGLRATRRDGRLHFTQRRGWRRG